MTTKLRDIDWIAALISFGIPYGIVLIGWAVGEFLNMPWNLLALVVIALTLIITIWRIADE